MSGIARDAGVSSETARGYFEILVNTLLGSWPPAFRPRSKVKEVALPKFYWFDAGVLHAAAGGFDQPLPSDWNGVLLEHFLLHELRSYVHYHGVKGSLGYWATPSGSEVDFVWWHGSKIVAIEAKAARGYRREFRAGIESLGGGTRVRSYIVYRGEQELRDGETQVMPLGSFLRQLHAGKIIG